MCYLDLKSNGNLVKIRKVKSSYMINETVAFLEKLLEPFFERRFRLAGHRQLLLVPVLNDSTGLGVLDDSGLGGLGQLPELGGRLTRVGELLYRI